MRINKEQFSEQVDVSMWYEAHGGVKRRKKDRLCTEQNKLATQGNKTEDRGVTLTERKR